MTPPEGDLLASNAEGELTRLFSAGEPDGVSRFCSALNYGRVTKVPVAINRAAADPRLCDAWVGDWIVMMRDPVALAARDGDAMRGIGLHRSDTYNLSLRCGEANHTLAAAVEIASRGRGVLMVSYEKMMTSPHQTFSAVSDWLGWAIDADAAMKEIVINDPRYLG